MKDQSFTLDGIGWQICFNGKVLPPSFNIKEETETKLSLLKKARGEA